MSCSPPRPPSPRGEQSVHPPVGGRVPDIDPRMSAHRSTGTCASPSKHAPAWKFSPYVTVPGAPPASAGSATWPAACALHLMPVVLMSPRVPRQVGDLWSTAPQITGPARFLPHPQVPSEVRDCAVRDRSTAGTPPPPAACQVSASARPAAAWLRRFPPGWSSLLGGIEELPLLRRSAAPAGDLLRLLR